MQGEQRWKWRVVKIVTVTVLLRPWNWNAPFPLRRSGSERAGRRGWERWWWWARWWRQLVFIITTFSPLFVQGPRKSPINSRLGGSGGSRSNGISESLLLFPSKMITTRRRSYESHHVTYYVLLLLDTNAVCTGSFSNGLYRTSWYDLWRHKV